MCIRQPFTLSIPASIIIIIISRLLPPSLPSHKSHSATPTMLRTAVTRQLATVGAALRARAVTANTPAVVVRALSSSSPPSSSNPSKSPYTHGAHRSNAEELVAQFPVTEVHGMVALCDGGGGAMGHPIEYIQLNTVGEEISECKYCGLRYKMSHHH